MLASRTTFCLASSSSVGISEGTNYPWITVDGHASELRAVGTLTARGIALRPFLLCYAEPTNCRSLLSSADISRLFGKEKPRSHGVRLAAALIPIAVAVGHPGKVEKRFQGPRKMR